mgnify:CR=1 FL=1
MTGALQDRGTLKGIATTLLSLALLAERAAGRSLPVRFLVLALLGRAEAIARGFVARAVQADCPELPVPDLPFLDEPLGLHYGAADAALLALRLRMLAAVLAALAGADGCSDDDSALRSADLVRHPGGAASRADPIELLVFPMRRPRSCRSPPLCDEKRPALPPRAIPLPI